MGELAVARTQLVSRERECAGIRSLIDEAREGRSGSVVLRGDPGIGKTALLEYASGLADGMTVLRTAGVDAESDLAFAGVFGLVRPILGLLDQLVGIQARALAGALGVKSSSGADRFLISAALLGLLAAAAEEQPVLCLVDDAQWLDQPSIDAISFAARRMGAEPIAMLFAAREGEARRFDGSGLPEVVVTALDDTAARELLAGTQPSMSAAVRDRLLAEAAGNPLALLELPSGLTDDQLSGHEPLASSIPLTPRVDAVFRGRIEQLPAAAQTALLLAAAESTGDLPPVLRAVGALGFGLDALEHAERAQLVKIVDGTITFRHPLVRTAAYSTATEGERQRAHAALAGVLSGDEHADRRVWHQAMATATEDEELAAALEASACRAQGRGGHASAATAFRRAAELSPDSARRGPRLAAAAQAAWDAAQGDRAMALVTEALPDAEGPLRARLLHLRGVIETRQGRIAEGVTTLIEAIAASTEPSLTLEMLHDAVDGAVDMGDRAAMQTFGEHAARLSSSTPREAFTRAAVIAYAAQCNGDYVRASDAFGEALELARELDDPVVLDWAARAASIVHQMGAGLPFSTRAVEVARRQGLVSLLPLALDQLAFDLEKNSEFDRAYAAAKEGYQLATEVSEGLMLGNLETIARVEAIRGHEAEAREHVREMLTLASRNRAPTLATAARSVLGFLELALGRLDHAAEVLIELVARPPDHGLPHHALIPVPDAIEAVMRATRNPSVVEAPLNRYREWVLTAPTDARRSVLARCEALTGTRPAGQAYGEAIELAEALPVFERARTQLLYGEWLRRERRPTQARPHLRSALEQFQTLGAAPWASRAEAELRATGETARKRDPSTLGQLTPRERTIAELAATGLSNPEIGAQLFLSPRTVEYHLGKVFSKLGIASRNDLIREGGLPE